LPNKLKVTQSISCYQYVGLKDVAKIMESTAAEQDGGGIMNSSEFFFRR